ncbi:hypothetical protein N9X61_01210 [Sulfurimonas sp.]|nr:hypothetical protein [Sulfurimonas sp.]
MKKIILLIFGLLYIYLNAQVLSPKQEYLGTSDMVMPTVKSNDMVNWRSKERNKETRQDGSTLGKSLHTAAREVVPFFREVEDERPLFPSFSFEDEKIDYSDPEVQEVLKDIGYEHNKEARESGSFEELINLKNKLEAERIDRQYMLENNIYTYIYFMLSIGIIIYFYPQIARVFTKLFSKYNNWRKKKEKITRDKKIMEITEEESIRASVKKSIDKSEDDELEDLQNLINKAVAKGDSETAEALLKILDKKKEVN